MNRALILLMYAGEYDFKSDSGDQLRGCTLKYYFWGENGEMLASKVAGTGAIGYQCAKSNADPDVRDRVSVVPGIYDAEFTMSVGGDGKAVLKLSDLVYKSDVRFLMADDSKDKK